MTQSLLRMFSLMLNILFLLAFAALGNFFCFKILYIRG